MAISMRRYLAIPQEFLAEEVEEKVDEEVEEVKKNGEDLVEGDDIDPFEDL